MRSNVGTHNGSTRVHAVVLTRDRTDVLQRCVNTGLATLGPDDALTVLDDSCASVAHANAGVLRATAGRSRTQLTHLPAKQTLEAIARVSGGRGAVWQSKTAPRDIAPLRNVSLLLSVVVDAQTTVLIDDDIDGFDLNATHGLLDAQERGPGGVIAGAEIAGTSEQDTLTRLSDAMCFLKTAPRKNTVPVEELFQVPADRKYAGADACGWVSAGYLAFRLPPATLFAFPPGYNEDWMWCLLHEAGGDTRVLRSVQAVVHDPPCIRRSSRDDILFELGGDFVLDCLAECGEGSSRGPEAVLKDLSQDAPDPSLMPSVRTETVLNQAHELSENGHGRMMSELKSYGLNILAEMQLSGELEMDGSRLLSNWSGDAALKQKSFRTTLDTSSVQLALRAMWQEGRL